MALSKGTKHNSTFVGGLITEATALTFPENAAADLSNCILDPQGNILRRLGLDIELGGVLSSILFDQSLIGSIAVTSSTWNTVNNSAENNFIVVQIGTTLYFHVGKVTTPSTQPKAFTVDLTTFLAPAHINAGSERVSMVSGRGKLFITSKVLEPFVIEYDDDLDTISTTEITLQIRDFEGVDDGLTIIEQPVTLSDLHKYNLYNQGWVHPDAARAADVYVANFKADTGEYPSNAQIWLPGKVDTDPTNLDSNKVVTFDFGASRAAQGYYILDAFNKDRTDVSGIGSFTAVTEDDRPRDIEFHAGRVWYSGNDGDVYFSQLLKKDLSNVGYCYQAKSPTAEEDSLLVDTDGGVINIPESGVIYALTSSGTSIIVYAENGVWAIQGTDGGFKATDYAINKVTSSGAVSTDAVIIAEGTPIYWGSEGIYAIASDDVSGNLTANSLTNTTIKTFYNDISDASQANAIGRYDSGTKKLVWLYQSDASSFNKYVYDRILTLDVLSGAFTPHAIAKTETSTPYIVAPIDNLTNVADGRGGFTRLKYMSIHPDGLNSTYSFSNFYKTDFLDWGVDDYQSYLLTGVDTQASPDTFKQAPYITVFCNRTETEVNGDGTLSITSSLRMQTRWDFSSSSISGKFGKSQQVYRYRRPYFLDPEQVEFDNGNQVVVTRNKVLGRGRSMQIYFSSETGKDFDLIGWSTTITGNTQL